MARWPRRRISSNESASGRQGEALPRDRALIDQSPVADELFAIDRAHEPPGTKTNQAFVDWRRFRPTLLLLSAFEHSSNPKFGSKPAIF
jgi:hypothetical protein